MSQGARIYIDTLKGGYTVQRYGGVSHTNQICVTIGEVMTLVAELLGEDEPEE